MRLLVTTLFLLTLLSCKKDSVKLNERADEMFWLTNAGSDMPVWVKGNTLSKTFILVLHGGPGGSSYTYKNVTQSLQNKYALVLWDQRNSGSSAGNINIDNLTFFQMVEDLEKIVKILKYRYGQDVSLFIYAHSFGGLLASSYLTKDSNQNEIKGWIEIDGAHNYPLCNSSSRQMLLDTGRNEIAKGKNISKWNEIVNYCENNDPLASFDVAFKISNYALEAEKLMSTDCNYPTEIFTPENPVSEISNLYKLYYTAKGISFNRTLESLSFSDQLYKIKKPCILLWGKYDFNVPIALANDLENKIGSENKKLVILPNSGHNSMFCDTQVFQEEVIGFVERFR